jgi:hypothetical protein
MMLMEAIEYDVCLSEQTRLVDKLDALRGIDPSLFWSQQQLDEALACCCSILEETGGSLQPVWAYGMAMCWNQWMDRFRREQMSLDKQLQERASTIQIPEQSLEVGSLVIMDGVTWKVTALEEQQIACLRGDRTTRVKRHPGRNAQLVLCSRR